MAKNIWYKRECILIKNNEKVNNNIFNVSPKKQYT